MNFPFTLLIMTLIWFPTQQDTNDLTKTKMALGGFCWSIFNFKQMAADMLQAETLQNRWPAEFTNWKSVVGGCCCTYVAQSASYSCSCTEPFILYELHSGKSYYPLDYGLVTLAKPYTYKVNLYKLSTFYKMNRLNQNNACLVTLIGHIWVDSPKNLRICKGK